MAEIKKIEVVARAAQGVSAEYQIILYKGTKLLIPLSKIKLAVGLTWELTHDPKLKPLAEELHVDLRKLKD